MCKNVPPAYSGAKLVAAHRDVLGKGTLNGLLLLLSCLRSQCETSAAL